MRRSAPISRRRLRAPAAAPGLALALACLMGSGCGKSEEPPPIVPAQGVVTLNGAPLPKAQVRFIPNIGFGPEYIAIGVTDEAGRFQLTCHGQPGACAVEHTVTVSEADFPPELLTESKQAELAVYRRSLKNRPIPKNYATPVQTPLKVNITAGQADYNLELRR